MASTMVMDATASSTITTLHACSTSSASSLKSSTSCVSMVSFGTVASISAFEGPSIQRRRDVSLRSSTTGGAELLLARCLRKGLRKPRAVQIVSSAAPEQRKVMIAGAPASGKGTQCELIVDKFGLTHISTGDLLRAEVAAGSETGANAKTYMDAGKLVPNEIVVAMVEKKLGENERGWLLDGYPRNMEQAEALEGISVRPQLFILLDVPDDILVERVVGRRMDPVTGKIYHIKYSPPETEEIASRLTQRFDDTEEKARIRLATYHANVEAVIGVYKDIIRRVDGNRPKKDVFEDIAKLLEEEGRRDEDGGAVSYNSSNSSGAAAQQQRVVNGTSAPAVATAVKKKIGQEEKSAMGLPRDVQKKKGNWMGVPTKLNTTPHSREVRNYFYADVCDATKSAVEDGIHKLLRVQVTIPELNHEMDVFRIGTLLEIIREMAFTFANDGKRVRVCVQGSMGEGIFSGMPLQLAGTRQMLDRMDWGEYGAKGTFINIGAVGAKEVYPEDDIFILMAPQNAVGNCIIDDLRAMVAAAGDRPFIIVNPRLKDRPGSGGVMQVQGRDKRLEFVGSFFTCYHFRLLYQSGTQYPILGALRRAYPSPYQLYKRIDTDTKKKEEYVLLPETYETEPSGSEIGDAYYGRSKRKAPEGIWAFLGRILN